MNRQFTALSGLAILMVLLNHAIDMGNLGTQELGYPLATGWELYVLLVLHHLGIFAVPTFLFISGSFISYAARRSPPKLPWKSVRAALKRILCPYLFWSIAFFVLVYFRKNEVYTPFGYLKNLVVGYPFHFIPILTFYYVSSPVLVRLADRFGYVLIAVIGLYQLLLISLVYPSLALNLPNWMHLLVPPVLGHSMALWGIYFPLGLVYSLKAKEVLPWLRRFRFVFLITTGVCFVLHILNTASVLHSPLAPFVCPLTFLFLAPMIERNSIPLVRQLEKVARRVYGLYLTHLIVLDLVVYSVQVFVPWVLTYQVFSQALLFLVALGVPLLVMNSMARLPTRVVYRYVFG